MPIFTSFHILNFAKLCYSASHATCSLRGRRLKGKGKGLLGARETRGAREEHSSSNIVGAAHAHYAWFTKLWVVFFPRCTAGPNIVGSCCIRLHTTANTHATTPNIVGATTLGVVASVCTQPNGQNKQSCKSKYCTGD